MTKRKSRLIYGPILSRRLGRSLGIDVISNPSSRKNCNFDCIYCQLGSVANKIQSVEDVVGCVSSPEIVEGIKHYHRNIKDIDYITFSGTCEPTLNPALGEMIDGIRQISSVPICVITNSSLAGRDDVRQSLAKADLVVATLVSGYYKTFENINRPASGILLADIIEGLASLSHMGTCRLSIEVMFVGSDKSGYNTSDSEISRLADILEYIDPDEIEVLTITRPPAESSLKAVDEIRLKEIASYFDSRLGRRKVCLVLRGIRKRRSNIKHENIGEEVYDLILRRPCTTEQIIASLGLNRATLIPVLEEMKFRGVIEEVREIKTCYYRAL
jgi:wyosine [tRNA(Phe)-imidazoG37] synthetase (radical SAM superfamily)